MFNLVLSTLVIFKLVYGSMYTLQIPDYAEDLRMVHLKLDKIMEALKIDEINYIPVKRPSSNHINTNNNHNGNSYNHPNTYNTNNNNYNNNNNNIKKNNNNNNNINKAHTAPNYSPGGINLSDAWKRHQNPEYLQHLRKSQEIEQGKTKETHIDLESDTDKNANSYKINSAGKELNKAENLKGQEYYKGEDFSNGKYDISDQKVEQKGRKFNQRTRSTRTSNITLLTDVSKDMKEKKGHETHAGNYKGNEFDVNYDLEQQNAEFKDFENNNKYDQTQYGKKRIKEGFNDKEKFDEQEYNKYGDNDNDEKYRLNKFNTGRGTGHNNAGTVSLHDKYTGKKAVPPKPNTGKYGGVGFERFRKRNDKEQDDNYKGYGNQFGGNGYYEAELGAESGQGFSEQKKGNQYINEGKLTKVKAKGGNKAASYSGDYRNEDRYHQLKDKQADLAYFKQRGSNIDPSSPNRNSLEEMDEVTYSRVEQKGNRDIVNFDGKYQEKEKKTHADKGNYGKIYKDEELYASQDNDKEYNGRLIGREKKYRNDEYKRGYYKPKNKRY